MIEDLRLADVGVDAHKFNKLLLLNENGKLSGSSWVARDFLDMSCVSERVVSHPEGFVDRRQR